MIMMSFVNKFFDVTIIYKLRTVSSMVSTPGCLAGKFEKVVGDANKIFNFNGNFKNLSSKITVIIKK